MAFAPSPLSALPRLIVGTLVVLAAGIGQSAWGAPLPPAESELLDNGVEVWVDASGPPGLFALRLDLLHGVESETDLLAGSAAGLGAWLVRASSPNLDSGGLEVAAHEAGIEVMVDLGRRRTSLTLAGRTPSAERALWLVSERLRGPGGSLDPAPLRDVIASLLQDAQGTAVSPLGDPMITLESQLLARPVRRSAFSSLLAARDLGDDDLVHIAKSSQGLPARISLVWPRDGGEVPWPLLRRELNAGPPRPRPRVREPRPGAAAPPPATRQLSFQYHRDERHLLLLGWDLRGVAASLGLSYLERDVAMLILGTWLDHDGSPLHAALVEDHGLARNLQVHVRDDERPCLILSAEADKESLGDAALLLVDRLQQVTHGEVPRSQWEGAARLASARLRRHLANPVARVALLGELVDAGHREPWARIEEALRLLEQRPAELVAPFARAALGPERRVIADFRPVAHRGARPAAASLDDEGLRRYLRLVVELRCPRGGSSRPDAASVRKHHGFGEKDYVAFTRAVSARPDLMRGLGRAADERCAELARLEGILAPAKVVEMHRALECSGPGTATRRAVAYRARVLKRFRVDPSWVLPLVEMAREHPLHGSAMTEIDRRCTVIPEETP